MQCIVIYENILHRRRPARSICCGPPVDCGHGRVTMSNKLSELFTHWSRLSWVVVFSLEIPGEVACMLLKNPRKSSVVYKVGKDNTRRHHCYYRLSSESPETILDTYTHTYSTTFSSSRQHNSWNLPKIFSSISYLEEWNKRMSVCQGQSTGVAVHQDLRIRALWFAGYVANKWFRLSVDDADPY